jgi:hypothetical protein
MSPVRCGFCAVLLHMLVSSAEYQAQCARSRSLPWPVNCTTTACEAAYVYLDCHSISLVLSVEYITHQLKHVCLVTCVMRVSLTMRTRAQ